VLALIFTLQANSAHAPTPYFMTPEILRTKNFNVFENSCFIILYLLVDMKLPQDDPKKIETCRSVNEIYVKVYV